MTLPFDPSPLTALLGFWSSLELWEWVEYISEFVVILGAAGEGLGEFTNFLGSRDSEHRKEKVLKVSTIVLLAGLAVELGSLFRVNALSGRIIENERLETARIYSRLGPRQLADEQRREIRDKLSKYSGIPVDVFVLSQEDRPTMDEALNFGKDLVGALGESMDASGFTGMGCRPWPVVGVIVEAQQDLSRDRYAAGDILDSLKSFGIEAIPYVPPIQIPPCTAFSDISTAPSKPRDRTGWAKIVIIVGRKPTPILSQTPASN